MNVSEKRIKTRHNNCRCMMKNGHECMEDMVTTVLRHEIKIGTMVVVNSNSLKLEAIKNSGVKVTGSSTGCYGMKISSSSRR